MERHESFKIIRHADCLAVDLLHHHVGHGGRGSARTVGPVRRGQAGWRCPRHALGRRAGDHASRCGRRGQAIRGDCDGPGRGRGGASHSVAETAAVERARYRISVQAVARPVMSAASARNRGISITIESGEKRRGSEHPTPAGVDRRSESGRRRAESASEIIQGSHRELPRPESAGDSARCGPQRRWRRVVHRPGAQRLLRPLLASQHKGCRGHD